MALSLTVGMAALATSAAGQAPKKADPKAAAPAQKGAPAQGGTPQSAWVKLCEKGTATFKKDGKDEKKDINVCMTHHERLDGNTGMVLVSAAIRQIEGQDKQALMVMVPLGMLLQPGMRAAVYPKDLWEKIQKNEKIDDSKLKQLRLVYTLCHPGGCTAEMEATAELLNEMKAGGGLMVFAINANGQPIAFPVPLNGFDQSYAGNPVDSKKYSEARKALMQQIAQRQQQLIEEHKKKLEEQQKTGAAPAAGQPATAAKAAPPAQKK